MLETRDRGDHEERFRAPILVNLPYQSQPALMRGPDLLGILDIGIMIFDGGRVAGRIRGPQR